MEWALKYYDTTGKLELGKDFQLKVEFTKFIANIDQAKFEELMSRVLAEVYTLMSETRRTEDIYILPPDDDWVYYAHDSEWRRGRAICFHF